MKTISMTSAFAVALVAMGCGGSTSGGNGGGAGPGGLGAGGGSMAHGTPIAQPDLSNALASSVCDHVQACCQSAGVAFDGAGCRENLMKNGPPGTATVPDGATYDAQAAGDCVAEIQQAVAACSTGSLPAATSACNRIVVGTKQAGAACTTSAECLAPTGGVAFCSSSSDGGGPASGGASGDPGPSICVVFPPSTHGSLGSPCDETCESSGADESCDGSAPTGGTFPKGSCFKNDGLTCGATNVCVALQPIGQPCQSDECVMDAYCAKSVCTALPGAGEACSQTTFPSACAGGLACVQGKCAVGAANGMSCQSSSDCQSGACEQHVCIAADSIATPSVCGSGSTASPAGAGPGTGGG